MAWRGTSTSPLLLLPEARVAVTDWNFASGSFAVAPGKFNTNGGAAPTLVTGGGAVGNAVRFYGVATDSFIYNFGDAANIITLPTNGLQLYMYHRTKAVSGSSGVSVIDYKINWYNGGGFFASEDHNYTLGTDIPLDGVYRNYRVAINPPGGAIKYSLELGKRDFTTSETCLNWFYLGNVLDGQDLGPYSQAQAIAPFDYMLDIPLGVTRSLAARYALRRANAGFNAGTLKATPVNLAATTAWQTFVDLLMPGTYFTLFHSQQDLSRDFQLRAYVESDDDGVEPVTGMSTNYLQLKWRTAP